MKIFENGLEISDEDYKILLDRISNVEDWVIKALEGHIERAKHHLIERYKPILDADPTFTAYPKDRYALISQIMARNDYENRAQRDEKERLAWEEVLKKSSQPVEEIVENV